MAKTPTKPKAAKPAATKIAAPKTAKPEVAKPAEPAASPTDEAPANAQPATVSVAVLKPFRHNGAVVHPGDQVSVTVEHRKALARNGLVVSDAPDGEAEDAPRTPGALTSGSFKPRRTPLVG